MQILIALLIAPHHDAESVFAGVLVFCAWILGFLVYFLPCIIASYKDSRYAAGVAILNLFLGWTLLGWVGALIWAVSAQPNTATQSQPAQPQRPA